MAMHAQRVSQVELNMAKGRSPPVTDRNKQTMFSLPTAEKAQKNWQEWTRKTLGNSTDVDHSF